ncbi:MAG TPA: DEAD/DEAH box helicase family protein [Falsiroseomonas sp.]|nr:DEAD/DEAH box helicase family protein [Falsiroseomonas sp.]
MAGIAEGIVEDAALSWLSSLGHPTLRRVIFTTLQKFAPEEGTTEHLLLTDRRNVVVIADEAHRSQHGSEAVSKHGGSIAARACAMRVT